MTLTVKKNTMHNLLYYMAFAIYAFTTALSSCTIIGWRSEFLQSYSGRIRFLCMALILMKLILDRSYQPDSLIFLGINFVIAMLVYLSMGNPAIMIAVLMIFGANNCSPKTIVKIHFLSLLSVLSISIFTALTGIVDDRTFIRGTAVRHSMGMLIPTMFGAVVFFLVVDYIYLRKRLKLVDSLIILIAAIFIDRVSDARLETILLFALVAATLFYKKIMKLSIVKYMSIFSFPIGALLSFTLVFLYLKYPSQFGPLNEWLSNRLLYSGQVMSEQPFTLFGTAFRMQGWGTLSYDWSFGYYYIDSFYMNYTMQYGIVFMVVLCIFVTHMIYKIYKEENYFFIVLIIFIAVHGIIKVSLLQAALCPIVMVLFARYKEQQKLQRKSLAKSRYRLYGKKTRMAVSR